MEQTEAKPRSIQRQDVSGSSAPDLFLDLADLGLGPADNLAPNTVTICVSPSIALHHISTASAQVATAVQVSFNDCSRHQNDPNPKRPKLRG